MSAAAGDAGHSPSIFATHIRYVLDREFERADRGTGRAELIFKSQVAIMTVAVAVIAFVWRDGHGVALNTGTVKIFGLAAVAAVVALLTGALGQSIPVKSQLTDNETFDKMLSAEYWHNDPNALYMTTCRDRDSVDELRKSNDKRAWITDVALWCQVSSVVLVIAAIVHEILRR